MRSKRKCLGNATWFKLRSSVTRRSAGFMSKPSKQQLVASRQDGHPNTEMKLNQLIKKTLLCKTRKITKRWRASRRYTGSLYRWGISRLTPLWGISRLTPLHPTNGMSYAPGSRYIVVGGKAVRNAWYGCHGRHLEGHQQAVRGIKGC